MEKRIIEFLSKYITLSKEEIEIISELNLIKKFNKGDALLKQGEVAEECYFILEGCVRSYHLLDGEEKTTEFYTENQPITPVSYTTRIPSEYYLSCVEDCIISLGSAKRSETLLKKVPKIEALIRTVTGELLADQQIKFDNYVNLSPEKRYLKLLETRPDLCQRVPQYQLASYLGIKPESLSRIRKRIKDKKMLR